MPTWTTEDSIPTTRSLPCSDMVLTLTGFMGSGKTTTGKILAERLGCAFLDLDQVIEEAQGMTIPEIFATQGEAAFRAAELEALEKLLENESKSGKIDLVLALGGGTLMTRKAGKGKDPVRLSQSFRRNPSREPGRHPVIPPDAWRTGPEDED